MYWTDYGTDTIQRANIGGLDSDELVTGLTSPGGLALDLHPAGLKMYWTDYGTDKIQRANLDGSEVEDLVTTGLRSPRGLAVDEVEGKIYWADPGTDKIQRANLDGLAGRRPRRHRTGGARRDRPGPRPSRRPARVGDAGDTGECHRRLSEPW